MKFGLFGGTFDPPHYGHLLLAEAAAESLQLAQVWFIPAADPPHKRDAVVIPAKHRVAMVNLAIANNPHFALSDIDLARPGPHYSADMVRLMHERYPKDELFFIMGGDSLADLPKWHTPAEIVRYAQLAVVHRPHVTVDLEALTAQIPELGGRVVFVPAPEIAVAARSIREQVAAGRSIRYQTPDTVIAYIRQENLYRNEDAVT